MTVFGGHLGDKKFAIKTEQMSVFAGYHLRDVCTFLAIEFDKRLFSVATT